MIIFRSIFVSSTFAVFYFFHTACAAAPLFTLCLKPETTAQSALIGWLAGSVVIGQPLRDVPPLSLSRTMCWSTSGPEFEAKTSLPPPGGWMLVSRKRLIWNAASLSMSRSYFFNHRKPKLLLRVNIWLIVPPQWSVGSCNCVSHTQKHTSHTRKHTSHYQKWQPLWPLFPSGRWPPTVSGETQWPAAYMSGEGGEAKVNYLL